MDSPKITYKYYSNPAFCAQSEVVFTQKAPCVSPRVVPSASPDRPRMSPLGANSPRKPTYESKPNNRIKTDISDNPMRNVNGSLRYIRDEPPELPPKPAKFSHSRNSSINSTLQRQRSLIRTSKRSIISTRSRTRSEDLEMSPMSMSDRVKSDDEDSRMMSHRYEVIKDLDDMDYSPTKKRIIESETDEYNVDAPDENEFKAIPTEIVKTVNGKTHRYAIVPSDDEDIPKKHNVTFSPPPMSQQHLIATQKLHELLSTPRKQVLKSYASQPSVRMISSEPRVRDYPQVYPVVPSKRNTSTPNRGVTTSKSCANLLSPKFISPVSPKAQQKLNYEEEERFERSPRQKSPDPFVRNPRQRSFDRTLEKRQRNRSLDLDNMSYERDRRGVNRSLDVEKHGREIGRSRFFDRESRSPKKMDRTTAIISPRLAPVQQTPSECSEDTTYKTWSLAKPSSAATASLSIAALMLTLCGGLTAGLSFYMMYAVGRVYYLDFSVLAGFTSLLLGMLGFRTRSHQLLPNRNYISGYILLSAFALLSCGGLLTLLARAPPPGSALADVTAGAVCGLSALSLCVASWGVLASYCCNTPPPDNRVGHL